MLLILIFLSHIKIWLHKLYQIRYHKEGRTISNYIVYRYICYSNIWIWKKKSLLLTILWNKHFKGSVKTVNLIIPFNTKIFFITFVFKHHQYLRIQEFQHVQIFSVCRNNTTKIYGINFKRFDVFSIPCKPRNFLV